MSKTISLKLDESIFEATDKIVEDINISRNKYINEALAYYNKIQRRKILEKKLTIESQIVGKESMKVLKEFELVDYGDQTI